MIKTTTEYPSSSNPVSADDEFNMIFLDTKAVAQYLGCSLPTARQIMYRADFPLIKVGKNLRVERSAHQHGVIDWPLMCTKKPPSALTPDANVR